MSDEERLIRGARGEPLARRRLGTEAATETAPWTHGPAAPGRGVAGAPMRTQGPHRGRGPHGYARSPARIYEDLCDRLTDNPFIDASDIEVTVAGTEVTLSGAVPDTIAMRQAQAIAEEVAGVTHVHNRLQLRDAAERERTPGKAVNEALGSGEEP
jgi:osmotically-inducible protein OsmY